MFKDQTRSTFFRHKFKYCYPISSVWFVPRKVGGSTM